MTEDTDEPQDNVVSLDEAREAKQENPWRITAVRYKEGKVMLKDEQGQQVVTKAHIVNIQFLNREPSRLITADGDKGHKDFSIPIPVGIRADQLYEILTSCPAQIEALLTGQKPDPEGAA